MSKKATFAVALKEFFGLREGTTNKDFLTEMRALSPEDRAFYEQHLKKAGYDLTETAVA